VLRGVAYVPGVRVTGRLRTIGYSPDGVLHISGSAAARGLLRVRNGVVTGRLGGRHVAGRLGPDLFDLVFREIPSFEPSVMARSSEFARGRAAVRAAAHGCGFYLLAAIPVKNAIEAAEKEMTYKRGSARKAAREGKKKARKHLRGIKKAWRRCHDSQ
jgi:hypothetical protein